MPPKKEPPKEVRTSGRERKQKQTYSPPPPQPKKRAEKQQPPQVPASCKPPGSHEDGGRGGSSFASLTALYASGAKPPGTICMETGLPQAPLNWRARDAAKLAASGTTKQARLAGTVSVRIRATPGHTLQALVKEKRVAPVTPVPARSPLQKQPKELAKWEQATGEFSTPQGQLPLSRLLGALASGSVQLVHAAEDDKLLNHLYALQSPLSSPWKRPLVRLRTALSPDPSKMKAAAAGAGAAAAAVEVDVTFFVYFGRLIFELIADADIQGVMSRMKPCGPVIPTTPLPPATPMFKRSPLPASALAKPPAGVIEVSSSDNEGEEESRAMLIDDESDDSVMVIEPPSGGGGAGSKGKGKKRKAPQWGKGTGAKGKGKGNAAAGGGSGAGAEAAAAEEAYEFEVGGLLRAAESEGYAIRDPQPPGLRISLFEYQHSTLQWMLDRERDPDGLNSHFWACWAWADGDTGDAFYYFPAAGELRLHKPPLRTGGLLCEEMGMGKTVELLALVLANPPAPHAAATATAAEAQAEEGPLPSAATLIITPSTLLGQYVTEIDKCTHMGAVPTAIYAGNQRVHFHTRQLRLVGEGEEGAVGRRCRAEDMREGMTVLAPVCVFDDDDEEGEGKGETVGADQTKRARLRAQYYEGTVQKVLGGRATAVVAYAYTPQGLAGRHKIVLTTYDTLRAHGQMLKKVHWHRVVVDECQELRVGTSQVARMAAALQATHRWMVSGTPIEASVDDVHGELQFLGIQPFGLHNDGFWESCIGNPFKRRSRRALELLHLLIRACMMRHSKGQTYLDGRPLLSLPARTIAWVPVERLSASEKFVYSYLEVLAAKECARLVEQALAAAAASAHGGSASRVRAAQALALQAIEASSSRGGGSKGRGAGAGGSPGAGVGAGAHGKLKALLFMMQRALCHPKQLALPQLDTIKRSLQIQQRLGLGSAGGDGGQDGLIPRLRIDDLLARLQGRNAHGGLVRDVGRTWAMAGDELERERDKLEALTLQELRARVEKEGLPVPIAWLQLPVRCAIPGGSTALEVASHNDNAPSTSASAALAAPSPPPQAFPAAVLTLGAPGGSPPPKAAAASASAFSPRAASAAAAASSPSSSAAAAAAAAASNGGGNKAPAPKAASSSSSTPGPHSSSNGGKRLEGLLAPQDVVRVGANDEDYERVVESFAVETGGQRGRAALDKAWGGEEARKALLFKKAPATRKKAYADLLLARERELKGAASSIHEAGFASIFALLEGHDQTCCLCLCTIQHPTVTQCCHVFCKACILAQIEEAKSHSGVPTTRCGICRKPVPLASLMELDVDSTEKYDELQHASSSAAAAAASAAAGSDADEDDDCSGGSAHYSGGKGKGQGKGRGKGKQPARKKSKTAAGSAAAAADSEDDGGGKMSPDELQADQSQSQGGGGGGNGDSAISLPTVAFPPTADEELLSSLPAPPRPVPRDHRVPSLDPALLGHVYAMEKVLSAKMAVLLADMAATLARDPKAKFVVFSQFGDSLDTLASALADQGYGCASISKHTAKAARQRAVSSFTTNPKVKVILVTMGTGAAGLTLTAASTVYLLEPSHSPADEAQALNRAHRIGQERPVRCLILFARGTVEERMLALRRREGDAFMSLLGGQDEAAALTSVGAHGGRDAEKRAHFSLAGFQALLGMEPL